MGPKASPAADIVSEVIDCIGLYNVDGIFGLEERIADPAYRRNFVSIVKRMYPRTPGIKGVGIAAMTSQGEMKVIDLIRPPEVGTEMPPFEQPEAEAGHPIRIVGQLFSAKSTQRTKRVEIRDDSGTTHSIDVPKGMLADVVKPYFEERVIAEVVKLSDETLSLIDVQGESESKTEQDR